MGNLCMCTTIQGASIGFPQQWCHLFFRCSTVVKLRRHVARSICLLPWFARCYTLASCSVKHFLKLNSMIFRILRYYQHILFLIKINNFRGGLMDTSAKKLHHSCSCLNNRKLPREMRKASAQTHIKHVFLGFRYRRTQFTPWHPVPYVVIRESLLTWSIVSIFLVVQLGCT